MISRVLPMVLLLCLCPAAQASCVILLHGLIRSPASMSSLETALQQAGYTTVNLGYPSRQHPIERLAELAITPALQHCPEESGIYFVTHSLGGILVRQYLSQQTIPQLKRVVMLGPPNQGSEILDKLGSLYGFAWINGPASLQLGTTHHSIPNQLGAVDFELGVIAGDKTINWVLSSLIPGKDDGKVSVARSKVAGMARHLVLPVNHVTMMKDQQVINATLAYLKSGNWEVTE